MKKLVIISAVLSFISFAYAKVEAPKIAQSIQTAQLHHSQMIEKQLNV